MEAVDRYLEKTGRKVMFEYIMIGEFIKTLRSFGISVIQRHRFGDGIKGACGQLSTFFFLTDLLVGFIM